MLMLDESYLHEFIGKQNFFRAGREKSHPHASELGREEGFWSWESEWEDIVPFHPQPPIHPNSPVSRSHLLSRMKKSTQSDATSKNSHRDSYAAFSSSGSYGYRKPRFATRTAPPTSETARPLGPLCYGLLIPPLAKMMPGPERTNPHRTPSRMANNVPRLRRDARTIGESPRGGRNASRVDPCEGCQSKLLAEPDKYLAPSSPRLTPPAF